MKKKVKLVKGGKTYWNAMERTKIYLANMAFVNAVCEEGILFRWKFGWQIIRGRKFKV